MAEIYLKSTLLEKYKKEFNKNLGVLMNEKCDNEGIPQNIATISDELSVKEYDELIDTCKDIIENDLHNNFCIFYFDVLDYSSNIAAQALFPIQKTPAGGIINDVFNLDPRYRIVLTEMVVFPLKEKTVCLGFCLKRDKERMQPFIGYMNGLPITAKRKLFQSTLMAYTEEIYTNQETINQIIQDKTTMSFILSALESGKTSASDLERGYIVKKPELVSTKGFRKVVFHI